MEKVAAVQSALVSGTYNVPASAVAGKMIDQLLGK
jgi:anti-sigma28 factor (negative regulator of flagellin synthesis)